MKKLNFTYLLTTLMSMIGLNASAHDIAVVNAYNKTIYYNYINDNTELSVTYQGSLYKFPKEYSGNIVIPKSVTYDNKTYSVTSIGERAFQQCTNMTSVTIPNSVTTIGGWAFRNTGLTSVTIPNSVTSIGVEAFSECSGLTSIKVQEGNSFYDSRNNCNAIIETSSNTLIAGCKNTIIPNNVTIIENCAFLNCPGLTSITIPNSVTSIEGCAFMGCSGLTSVTIPNSVTSIGHDAFVGCSGLVSIIVQEGNSFYDSRNDCNAIIETSSNTLIAGCKNTVIPNSVTSIGWYAFCGCLGLTSVTIPNSVTSIGERAFMGCSGLTSVTIGNSVTNIGSFAFRNCSNMTSVTIGNSVTSIGERAFEDCLRLTSIYSYIENPTSNTGSKFDSSNYTDATLYVPSGTKDKYLATAGWKKFTNIVEMGETAVKEISASNINEAKSFSIDGKRLSQPQKGLNILKMSDGTTRKVVK